MALKLHGARRLTIKSLGCTEGFEWICRSDFRKRGSRSQTRVCRGRRGQCRDHRAGKGIRGARHQGRRAGQQCGTGRGDDRTQESFFEKWAPAHNLTVEEAMKKFPEEVGIRRFGKPEEIADLMAYLVSPAAKWMTGASVRMDGGEIKGI